jgi:anti-anti-sigma factor
MYEPSEQSSLVKVSLVADPPFLFLDVGGELDLCSIKQIPREAYPARPDLRAVLVDLGEVSFCDLTGLRALLAFRRIHEAQGRSVEVVRASPFVWKVMRLCGVSDRLEIAGPVKAPA